MKIFALNLLTCTLKVGTWREYFFAALIVAICLFARFGDFESLRGIGKLFLAVSLSEVLNLI